MKPQAACRKKSNRRHSYTKVRDNRKHPVNGLWRRSGRYLVRITVEDDLGRRSLKWGSLKATTIAEAQVEMRTVLVERSENRLRHVGKTPRFANYPENSWSASGICFAPPGLTAHNGSFQALSAANGMITAARSVSRSS